MTWLKNIWCELLALFVDDGSFAAAIIAWLGGGTLCLRFFDMSPVVESFLLPIGFAFLLLENIERSARDAGRRRR
jgi:hypothetical protein